MTTIRMMAGALLAATLAAAPAAAAIKVATYEGTVASGYDRTGEFGTPDTDLTGKTFVATYVYNTSLGYRSSLADRDEVWGGSAFGVPSPVVSATIGIGGAVWVFASTDANGLAVVDTTYFGDEFAEYHPNTGPMQSNNFIENYGFQTSRIDSLDTNFDAVSTSPDDYGYVQIYTHDGTSGTIMHYAYADLGAASLVVGSVAEPATWALMIGGFGMAGTLARRRRARATCWASADD